MRSDGRLEQKKRELTAAQLDLSDNLLVDIVDGKLVDRFGAANWGSHQTPLGDTGAIGLHDPSSIQPLSYASDASESPLGNMGAQGGPLEIAPAAQVLSLAVGLLGLEVHESPNPWAEAWLTLQQNFRQRFGVENLQSADGQSLAIKMPDGGRPARKKHWEQQAEWQTKVLNHLQNLISFGRIFVSEEEKLAGPPQVTPPPGDVGTEFSEQLEIAEFCLRRVTHAVGCLQDPAKQDRPISLKEFTEEMVMAVSQDLRQWLEQLGTVLSLYHVRLLDNERERRRLSVELSAQEAKWQENEDARRTADVRYDKLEQLRQEEKMKKRAEFLLGVSASGGDAKIYSQVEVDDMLRQWKREHVVPVLADLADLKRKYEDLQAKLDKRSTRTANGGEDESASTTMIRAVKAFLTACSERTENQEIATLELRLASALDSPTETSDILKELYKVPVGKGQNGDSAESLATEVEERNKILSVMSAELSKMERVFSDIPVLKSAGKLCAWVKESTEAAKTKFPKFQPAPTWNINDFKKVLSDAADTEERLRRQKAERPQTDRQVEMSVEQPGFEGLKNCLSNVSSEMTPLIRSLKGMEGGEGVATFLEWCRDTINIVKASPENPRWRSAPKWDITKLGGKGETNVVASTGGSDGDLEAMWRAKLDALRAEGEEKMRKVLEDLENEKQNTADALRRLAEETKRADEMINALKKKILEMEGILKKKGLGQQAHDAMWESGLAEFLNGRDVFERLYRDALLRLRRLAEARMKALQESSDEFHRNLHALYDPLLGQEGVVLCSTGADRPSGVLFQGRSGDGSPTLRNSGQPLLHVTRLVPPGSDQELSSPSVTARGQGEMTQPPVPVFPCAVSVFPGGSGREGAREVSPSFQAQGYCVGGTVPQTGQDQPRAQARTGSAMARSGTAPTSLYRSIAGGALACQVAALAVKMEKSTVLPPLECVGVIAAAPILNVSPTAAAIDGCARTGNGPRINRCGRPIQAPTTSPHDFKKRPAEAQQSADPGFTGLIGTKIDQRHSPH